MLTIRDILQPENVSYTDNVWTWAVAHMLHKGEDWQITTITDTAPIEIVFLSKGEPLMDYLISGNTVQDGTPTPDNPVDVVGCGERTENLFDYKTMKAGKKDYYIDASGNEISNTGFWSITKYIPVDGTVFTLTRTFVGNTPAICLYDSNKNFITGVSYQGKQVVTISSNTNTAYIRFSYFIGEPLEDVAHDMLNTGSTALPYEPYGYKLPLTIGGTEYPIYLGQVPTTRRIKKLVLTGREDWEIVAGSISYPPYFRLPIGANGSIIAEMIISTHYEQIFVASANSNNGIDIANSSAANASILKIRDTSIFTSTDTLKAYLAAQYANGTPVTVWYVLAEPETAVVNEPLMKIGDYADTVSMAQAGVTIPTVAGANALTVDTTVQPSVVSITGNIKEVST